MCGHTIDDTTPETYVVFDSHRSVSGRDLVSISGRLSSYSVYYLNHGSRTFIHLHAVTDSMRAIENIEAEGNEYINLSFGGELRISISKERDEVLVYKDGQDEPEGRFALSNGGIKNLHV